MRRIGLPVIFTFSLALAPLDAEAQQTGKVYRIAYLGNSSAALESELVAAFRQGLQDLKYVEGQNIAIEYRWAEGRYDRFPALVAEAADLMNAILLLEQIRTLPSPPRVILMSGSPLAVVEEEALASGAFAFLRKPVALDELARFVVLALQSPKAQSTM